MKLKVRNHEYTGQIEMTQYFFRYNIDHEESNNLYFMQFFLDQSTFNMENQTTLLKWRLFLEDG